MRLYADNKHNIALNIMHWSIGKMLKKGTKKQLLL